MLSLKNNPILNPHQLSILRLFFNSPLGKNYFFTGGTALSAFYLAHRHSQDLDLFTHGDFEAIQLSKIIEVIAEKTDSTIKHQVKYEKYFEIYLVGRKQKWLQRLDFVAEQPVHFGKVENKSGILVDSLINIATNKILAIYGRLDVKDYVDLYFILQEGYDFFELFDMAKKKDTGLHEFYFANMIVKVKDFGIFPKLLRPFDKRKFYQTFMNLSNKLLLRVKPKKKIRT